MNCLQCEERIAAAARDGERPAAVTDHLARCQACREFDAQMAQVAAALAHWQAPIAADAEAVMARSALVNRLVATRQRALERPLAGWAARILLHPAVIALPGAVAMAAGAAMAPGWAQHVVGVWAAAAALLASLVLLHHRRGVAAEGEE